jgi:hypothetical protein
MSKEGLGTNVGGRRYTGLASMSQGEQRQPGFGRNLGEKVSR